MKHQEAEEQIALMEWAMIYKGIYPELDLLFHIPNGGKRNVIEATRFKAMGVKPGVPDLFLPVPKHGKHGLFIELKAKGGKLSENQKKWLDRLNGMGYCADACVGWENAKDLIEWYLK